MATAKAGPRKATRMVTLKLTEGEADLVLFWAGITAGHPSKSPRKYANRINRALEKALGYKAYETDANKLASGALVFSAYGSDPVPNSDKAVALAAIIGMMQTYSDEERADREDEVDRLMCIASLLDYAETNGQEAAFLVT